MFNYLDDTSINKPMSIAVFGNPGSGKSFGIKQILKGVDVPVHTFNLSEANETMLPGFFHQIRDYNLKGKTPLYFFDEFDTDDLNWLVRFLAPIQDGEFRDADGIHPTGRGIFVFAGGTKPTFSELSIKDEEGAKKKKPDFVSWLSGYIDIRGPNPDDRSGVKDQDYVLRRAPR